MERDMPEELLYEGKAKKLFITEDPQILRVEYKDDATAFNGKKFDRLRDKGRLNNAITVFFSNTSKQKTFRVILFARFQKPSSWSER